MAKYTPEEHFMRKLDAKMREAIDKYSLIEEGDRVLIGLSGGKDSLALVELLGRKKRIFRPRFEVVAAHITMENIPYQSDLEYLEKHCRDYDIPFIHATTSFDESSDHRKSPCFLCSWNRRKQLFTLAKEHNCTKIALGHHQDDVIQTLLMNMTFQGAFGTMPPKLKMEKFDMTIIRPMCLMAETDLIRLSEMREYRKQKKNCPHERTSNRGAMKDIVKQLEALNPQARHHIWGSMTNIQQEYLPQEDEN